MRTRDEILAKITELEGVNGQFKELTSVRSRVTLLRWVLGSCSCGHPHRTKPDGTQIWSQCTECNCQFGDGEPLNRVQPVENPPRVGLGPPPSTVERAHTEPVPEHIDDDTVQRFKLLEID